MNAMRFVLLMFPMTALAAANCSSESPSFSPVTQTYEASCKPGQQIVNVLQAKSPVVKLDFGAAQEITVSTHSGAKSAGHNGRNAQVCIWRSWALESPCGQSARQESFNEWDGKASCALKVPAGPQYVRAWQTNENADEHNTTIVITCR